MRRIIFLLFMALSLPVVAASTPSMKVTMSAGDVKEYFISNISKITYSGSDMIITTTSGGEETISTDAIAKITLAGIEATGIDDVAGGKAEMDYSVYKSDGRLLLKGKVSNGRRLPLNSLPNGEYIICIDGKTIKVVK